MNPTLRTDPTVNALLSHPFPAGFARTLADTHGWSNMHASLVLEEYRRFLVLTLDGPATASHDVALARSLHRTVHPADWQAVAERCGEDQLSHPWDLTPESQYNATLDRYAQTFGRTPNLDIWPDPRQPRPSWVQGFLNSHARLLSVLGSMAILAVLVGTGLLSAVVAALIGIVALGLSGTLPFAQNRLTGNFAPDAYSGMYVYGGNDCGYDGGGGGDGGGSSC